MRMEKKGILNALKLCKSIRHLHQVHAYAITSGILLRDYSLLVNILYAITSLDFKPKTSTTNTQILEYATSVFSCIENPNTFAYNTMMRAHILSSSPTEAILLFSHMRRFSVAPDFHTFPFVLKATHHLPSLSLAFAIHSQAYKFGLISDQFVINSLIHVYSGYHCLRDSYRLFQETSHHDVVSYNVLINGFVKAGDTQRARQLFDEMPVRDAVSWGTLVAGYAQMGQCNEAINLFNEMLLALPGGVRPDNISIVSALSACAQLGHSEQGIAIHNHIIQNEIETDSFLSTALVDFYAKCGCIETAMEVFMASKDMNLFTWNAMLVGLALHGLGKASLKCFFEMIRNGIQPDGVTLLGVLVGCSHTGLVSEARKLFDDMEAVYGVPPDLRHYGCMADLLGRAGLIVEALEMIEKMPVGGDIYVWGALLSGCRLHGLVEVAEKVAERVKTVKPVDGGVYSVMANIYANAELWDDVVKIRGSIKSNRSVKKSSGCSWVTVDGKTHEFMAGDDLHPQNDKMYKDDWIL